MTAFLLISTGILLLIAVPIGMAMGTASLLTILQGGTLNALIITQKLLSGVSKFSLLAIPMFTLAGEVMTLGGVSDKLIYLANRVVGRFKGGLSMVTTLACMFFGAISGSATATAAAIGGIMVEPMGKVGYKGEYAAGVIASSGLLGLIIPPSGTMLMYAIVADVSVLEMFTGGIIPGIIMGLSLMVVEYFRAKRNGYGTSELDIAEFHTQSKAKIVIQSFLALLSPVIILGGIYSGKFTATEAAGVSVLYGFIIGYFVFKQLNIKKAYEACVKTGVSTSMILFLIGAGHIIKGNTVVGILLLGLQLGKGHGVAPAARALHEDIPEAAHEQHGEQQRQHIEPPGHGLGGIIVLLDGCIGMLGIILIYQGVGILQEQAEIRHTVGDGGLFLILKVIDDGAVLHLGLGGIHAENADRHVEEQRDEHYRGDPVSLFG